MEMIKTTKTFWHYDKPRSWPGSETPRGSGWPSAIYFDREANVFRVLDVTTKHVTLTFEELPPDNTDFEFETDELVQYSRDHFDNKHDAKIVDKYPFRV